MSYENNICPCGGKKPTETMLCPDCQEALKDRREMQIMQDEHEDVELRRHAAIILLTLARNMVHTKISYTGYGPIEYRPT